MLTSSILSEEGIIKPEALEVPIIKDTIENVDDGERVVLAVHMITYPFSPYSTIHQDKIETEVREDFPEYAEALNNASSLYYIERLKEKLMHLYSTPSKRFRDSLARQLDIVSDYGDALMKITDGKDGNLSQIRQLIKDSPSLLNAFKETDNIYKEELKSHRGMSESWDDKIDYSNMD